MSDENKLYAFNDTETTGLNTWFSQIIQIGSVLSDENFEVLEELDISSKVFKTFLNRVSHTDQFIKQKSSENLNVQYEVLIEEKLKKREIEVEIELEIELEIEVVRGGEVTEPELVVESKCRRMAAFVSIPCIRQHRLQTLHLWIVRLVQQHCSRHCHSIALLHPVLGSWPMSKTKLWSRPRVHCVELAMRYVLDVGSLCSRMPKQRHCLFPRQTTSH